MALTVQQRQRRQRTIIITAAVLVFGGIFGRQLWSAMQGPKLPGYAKTAPAGDFIKPDWTLLQKAQWPDGKAPIVPGQVTGYQGKEAVVEGYLLPLHNPGESSSFFIAPKPRGCYFCNPPDVGEVVQVNIAGGKEVPETDWRVRAYGRFAVAKNANDSILYALDDATLMISK